MLKLTDETNASTQERPPSPDAPQATDEPHPAPPLDYGQVCAHLANERAFLAWACTGMLLMGFGVAIAKLRLAISTLSLTTGAASQSNGAPEISPVMMGLSFLALGLVTIMLSGCRYLTVQTQLRKHRYHLSNLLFYLFLTALAILGGTLILHVWQLRQTLG